MGESEDRGQRTEDRGQQRSPYETCGIRGLHIVNQCSCVSFLNTSAITKIYKKQGGWVLIKAKINHNSVHAECQKHLTKYIRL